MFEESMESVKKKDRRPIRRFGNDDIMPLPTSQNNCGAVTRRGKSNFAVQNRVATTPAPKVPPSAEYPDPALRFAQQVPARHVLSARREPLRPPNLPALSSTFFCLLASPPSLPQLLPESRSEMWLANRNFHFQLSSCQCSFNLLWVTKYLLSYRPCNSTGLFVTH